MLAREINILKGKLNKDDDEWSTDKSAMFDLFLNKESSKLFSVDKKIKKDDNKDNKDDAPKEGEEPVAQETEQ